MTEKVKNLVNPFPGLRPFGLGESHLFYGREGQSQTILEYLAEYRFAAVTGASGSGKSSLIYCGVVPLLYGGFIPQAKNKWSIVTTRPGNTPVWNLAQALSELESQKTKSALDKNKADYFYSLLGRHSLGLVDTIEQVGLDSDENLLIVIDQFEELFRYSESSKKLIQHKDEPETFIKLLVNCIKYNTRPVYIVITMRSDFIGRCSDYQDFTGLINQSNFLVPQMTRSDFEHVITGPLKVVGNEIEPRLVQTLLNSIEHKHDQLPVLQHVMMRTWEFWHRHNSESTAISLRDYMAAGKIENALSLHANEAFSIMNDKQRQLCKLIFKALTEKGSEGKGIRRPAAISELSEITLEQVSEIIPVIEILREPGRSFLTPSIETSLTSETVIDISHESLMRIWDKLQTWVSEEAASSQMYLRLIELAGLYQMGRTGLMRPPDLHLATNWKKTQNPNRSWAKRYHPAFEKAMVYLNTSEKKLQQEEESKSRIQRRELYRTRRIAIVMGVFAISFLGLMFYTYRLSQDAIKQRDLAEGYAKILEGEKDTAVRSSMQKEYERLFVLRERDSAERVNFLKLVQQEEQTEQAYQIVDEITKRSEQLEVTAEQIKQEKALAEQQAKLAQEGLSQAEIDKMMELRKRMLVLSQTVALKSSQTDDAQLSGLLAMQSYFLNRESGGQNNHPDIYRSLLLSLYKLKGKKYNTLVGQKGSVNDLIFDPARNILYSADNTGSINKWTFRKENPLPSLLVSNEDANTCMAITVDGRWIACGSEDRTVHLINALQTTQAPRVFDAHDGSVTQVCFIPGRNAMVTAGADNKVKYWDLLVNESSLILQDASGINDIDVSPSGQNLACATGNGRLVGWNVASKKSDVIFNHNAPIMSVAYDFENERIAFGDKNGKILIINAQSGKLIKTLSGHASRILDLKFSPDNRMLASSGLDGVIRIWNASDWNDLPVEIKEQESWVKSLAFSPDGSKLYSSSNNNNLIYIWPVKATQIADEVCGYLKRQLTQQEWNAYFGSDVAYKEVCK
jgi:WD40 repeat protein